MVMKASYCCGSSGWATHCRERRWQACRSPRRASAVSSSFATPAAAPHRLSATRPPVSSAWPTFVLKCLNQPCTPIRKIQNSRRDAGLVNCLKTRPQALRPTGRRYTALAQCQLIIRATRAGSRLAHPVAPPSSTTPQGRISGWFLRSDCLAPAPAQRPWRRYQSLQAPESRRFSSCGPFFKPVHFPLGHERPQVDP